MKNLKLAAVATSLCLALSAAAVGAPLSKAQYQAGKDEASNKYKSDKAACRSMSGNAQDICIEEAKGRESIAKAELEAKYEPSAKHSYEVRLATAEAAYAVAKEKCDALLQAMPRQAVSARPRRITGNKNTGPPCGYPPDTGGAIQKENQSGAVRPRGNGPPDR